MINGRYFNLKGLTANTFYLKGLMAKNCKNEWYKMKNTFLFEMINC